MDKTLADAFYTLGWAKQHIRRFKREVDAFALSEPYGFVEQVDPVSGKKVPHYVRTKPIPRVLDGIFGDAIHNLRASLEQATHAVSASQQWCDFPFGDDVDDFNKRISPQGKSRNLPVDLGEALRRLKPYKGGNRTLWAVHELDIISKHRRIVRVLPEWRPQRIPMSAIIARNPLFVLKTDVTDTNDFVARVIHRESREYHDDEHAPFVRVEEIEGVPDRPSSILLYEMFSQVEGALELIRAFVT